MISYVHFILQKHTLEGFASQLAEKWKLVLEPLQPLIDFVQPFVDVFKSIMDAIKGLKWGYKKLKEA